MMRSESVRDIKLNCFIQRKNGYLSLGRRMQSMNKPTEKKRVETGPTNSNRNIERKNPYWFKEQTRKRKSRNSSHTPLSIFLCFF